MKKIYFILFVCLGLWANAKKVKFSVNMTGQTVSAFGIHVVGDFQVAAGFALDWDPSLTEMFKETIDTNIYSVVVDIPAFHKYEYRFINGNQTYESEFIPDESRVGYNLIDNRWIYIDSLDNDTTQWGAILFGGNAPVGLTLVRYKVDMTDNGLTAQGLARVITNYNSFDFTKNALYSFESNVFEVINYVPSGSNIEYKYTTGANMGSEELVPSQCALNNNRYLTLNIDTVLPTVCFASCSSCLTIGLNEKYTSAVSIYPNPSNGFVTLTSNEVISSFEVTNLTGQVVSSYKSLENKNQFDLSNLDKGVYFMKLTSLNGSLPIQRIIIE